MQAASGRKAAIERNPVSLERAGSKPLDEVHAWLVRRQAEGGMDPKWMPDFIRIIEKFPVTDTHKIVVRPYKREHYNLERNPAMRIYFRSRGDGTYHVLTPDKYREIKAGFIKNGREALLD